jgi:hypothetical protein
MQKMLIIPFFAAILLLGICWGCKKSSSSSSSPSNDVNVSLITQASWKYDTSGIDLDEDGKIDNNDIPDTVLKSCEKDDVFTFDKDSSGLIDEGPTKCNVANPQTDPLSWEFTSSDKVLNVTSNTVLNGNLNILSLTASNFVLYKDTTYLGFSFRYLIALKH